jgi:hypothetical protein
VPNLPFGSGGVSRSPSSAHLPTSAPFRVRAPDPVSGRLCETAGGGPATCPGFPSPFGAPAFASWASCSRQGTGPSLPPAYRRRLAAPRTLTRFPRSACTSCDRGGRPLDPEASGVHTASENSPAAACRSSTARPCTPVFIPSPEALGNEASAGVHSRSPVRPSPRLPSRMERVRFGFFPELRTPQLPAAHVRAGTDLEHWPGATSPTPCRSSNPQAHSQHATSCRTSSAQSSPANSTSDSSRSSPPVNVAAAGGEHQRPNGTVLTPAGGHDTPSVVLLSSRPARALSLPRAGHRRGSPQTVETSS